MTCLHTCPAPAHLWTGGRLAAVWGCGRKLHGGGRKVTAKEPTGLGDNGNAQTLGLRMRVHSSVSVLKPRDPWCTDGGPGRP